MTAHRRPYVAIASAGRLVHHVRVMVPYGTGELWWDATTRNAPWRALGRRHADWLGRRKLRRYLRWTRWAYTRE